MMSKYMTSALISAALIAIPATKVTADAGDFIAGAIIGGIVGANANKNKQRKRTTTYRPRLPSTQEGRMIQTSLNYFGFPAGTVDGQLGRKSRNAISQYQAHMGYPVTGNLTDFEQQFLITSYQRAQAGGQATLAQMASLPQGARGLLIVYRDELAGNVAQTTPVVVPVPAPNTVVTVPAPTTTVVAVAPQAIQPQPIQPTPVAPTAAAPTEAAASPSALPNFGGTAQTVSLASHCNAVSLLTNSNGGFTTAANMTDPHFVLNEQFCLARTYAIAQGEDMVSRLGSVTPAQVTQQCAAFGPAMQEQLVAASTQPMENVLRATSSFVVSTGMTAADLLGTAKVCLSSGYRTDDLDVAIGSALLLSALGEKAYAELVGHHLSQGFGLAKRPDLAQTWYGAGTAAIEAGAPAVFAPGQPERTDLVKQASLQLSAANAPVTTPQPAALPTFSLSSD